MAAVGTTVILLLRVAVRMPRSHQPHVDRRGAAEQAVYRLADGETVILLTPPLHPD